MIVVHQNANLVRFFASVKLTNTSSSSAKKRNNPRVKREEGEVSTCMKIGKFYFACCTYITVAFVIMKISGKRVRK